MKLHTTLCDGGETFSVEDLPQPSTPELLIDGQPYQKRTDFGFFPGLTIETERHLYYERHQAVLAYARANRLNRVEVRSDGDRLGIVTAGKSYGDTREALTDLGLADEGLRRHGIRLLRVGLTYPLDPEIVRDFAEGLDEIVVVEEKRGFLESQVKEALSGSSPVLVVGKFDEEGRPLFPIHGSMDADLVRGLLANRLERVIRGDALARERLEVPNDIAARDYTQHLARTPNYCSGCPHNLSTRLADGQLAWGSPGCHAFASIMEQPHRHIESMTQLGGEGLPWIGLSHFTEREHIVQNVGDGSLFHSSYLNIRFALAAGVNITFKVLFNGYIANTGAQQSPNARTVPELTRMLDADRIPKVVVLTKDPARYEGAELGGNTSVRPADELIAVEKELEELGGVTVIIYDESCANERQRQQRRGRAPVPNRFVVINESVCENCGHCGELTNCMSLQKVETEFGPKTQVHASTCAQDYFCLQGDCPSFVTVETQEGTGYRQQQPPDIPDGELVDPERRVSLDRPYNIYLPGIGGTGVITLNALLAFAALSEGRHVTSYDQTGAAQKWGSVVSSLTIAPEPVARSYKVGAGAADLYLALDIVGAAAPQNLSRCSPDRTAAVVNTGVYPTGEMTRNVHLEPDLDGMRASIDRWTHAERNVHLDVRAIAETLFGTHMLTNIAAVGAAYQAGLLPLRAESIEGAIQLNGVAVDANIQAFRYGRLAVADPDRVAALVDPTSRSAEQAAQETEAKLSARQGRVYRMLMEDAGHLDEGARRILAVRVGELIAYQDADYAARYVRSVVDVAARAGDRVTEAAGITHAYARNLYKLMAYKDEYEVARLHLDEAFRTKANDLFERPRKLTFHLHPPLLRALGMRRKLRFGEWVLPVFRLLYAGRRLRGTPLDPFGRARVRREERRLIGWYEELVDEALAHLEPGTEPVVAEIADLPDGIRGYEDIKLDSINRAEQRAAELRARLRRPTLPILDSA